MVKYEDIERDKPIIKKLLAQRKHENFIKYCWQNNSEPLSVGLHTRELCRLIDEAFETFRNGESVFLVVTIPFRHGKSDCLSRYLPAHFLGEFPDCEVMLATYSLSLAQGFSRFGRGLIRTKEYKELYPDVDIAKDSSSIQQWGIQGHLGGVTAGSISAGLTGKGYHLGLLDDYCGSRADAESENLRNTAWEHFTNDFFTRRAPRSITIVLATPWHTDDIIGRIKQRIDPNSPKYDPHFPKFKVVSFPAKNGDVDIKVRNREKYGDNLYHEEHVHYDYLFPERFSPEWYEQQFASLGDYASSALLQCNPTIKGGNLLNLTKMVVHHNINDFPNIKFYRIWDLAHTQKQTQKDDPDWTSGTLLAYRKVDGDKWELWVKDVARIRANAPERDNFIRAVAEKDGVNVTIAVENSIESKDALNHLQYIFNGRRIVRGINCKGDKVSRMSYVEPIFDGGNVHYLSGGWNLDWINELKEFPSGKHDDQIDNLSAGYELCCNNNGAPIIGGISGW